MFGQSYFYNETTRKVISVFGTLFNDIRIKRFDNSDNEVHEMLVPIAYGPSQKFLARLEQNPDLQQKPAIQLPRMSFQINGIFYDAERKLGSTLQHISAGSTSDSYASRFAPTPYNIDITLFVMVKYQEDGLKIIEQILPYFRPDWTPSVKLIEGLDQYFDVPIILNSVNVEDTYEGDFDTRRAIVWDLSFTIKTYFFGPSTEKKMIKFANTNIYSDMTSTDPAVNIKVQPGLTANGQPTTDLDETVSIENIDFDDDWDYIVTITEE